LKLKLAVLAKTSCLLQVGIHTRFFASPTSMAGLSRMFVQFLFIFCASAKRERVVLEEMATSNTALGADEAALQELGAGGPAFDPAKVAPAVQTFTASEPLACGTVLEARVVVKPEDVAKIAKDITSFFGAAKSGSQLFVAEEANGKGWWSSVTLIEKSGFPMDQGQLLLRAGGKTSKELAYLRDLLKFLKQWPASAPLEFVFDAGLDLRRCWGDLRDEAGEEVCGQQVLGKLAEELGKVEPILDDVGMSGSTIITNVDNFIVKNVKDLEEYYLMKKAMPKIGEGIQARIQRDGGCYSTALAPMCAAIVGPNSAQWLLMRKVGLKQAQKHEQQLGDDKVDWLDLKGPKFANSMRDGKTYFGSAELWHRKDSGFAAMFPEGLELFSCGSRDAAYALQQDTDLLMANSMTDYSLYAKFYDLPEHVATGDGGSCGCKVSEPPVWPVVLPAISTGVHTPTRMRLAIGIIDYVEQRVNDDLIGGQLSTMKDPATYQAWWMRMWPQYFHLMERDLEANGVMKGLMGAPAEQFEVGQRVAALTKLKWAGGYGAFYTNKVGMEIKYPDLPKLDYAIAATQNDAHSNVLKKDTDGRYVRKVQCYFNQIKETSSEKAASGSKYKIYPGMQGTIVSITDDFGEGQSKVRALVVAWDRVAPGHKVFRTTPVQVLGLPRQFMG